MGALVSRQEDLASASMPVQVALMVPFFAVLSLSDNAAAMRVLSYVPFTAPMAMRARLFGEDAGWWEPAVSLVVLLAATVVLIAVGARVYEGSLLRTGARVSLLTAWRGREPVPGSGSGAARGCAVPADRENISRDEEPRGRTTSARFSASA